MFCIDEIQVGKPFSFFFWSFVKKIPDSRAVLCDFRKNFHCIQETPLLWYQLMLSNYLTVATSVGP